MTTRVAQSTIAFLTENDAPARVAQSAVAFLTITFPLASPARVAQSAVAFLVRPYPVNSVLTWKPACSVSIKPELQEL